MSACEACWEEAFYAARLYGGLQADWYRIVLAQNENVHRGDRSVGVNADWRADGLMSEPLPLVAVLRLLVDEPGAEANSYDWMNNARDRMTEAADEIERLRDNLQAIADRGFCEEFGCLECKSVRVAVMALEWEPGQVAT